MKEVKRSLIAEVCEQLGVEQGFIVHCIELHWIHPASTETMEFDEEDIARIELIRELREDFGVNEEAVPVILHLLDQIYSFRRHVLDLRNQLEKSDDRKTA